MANPFSAGEVVGTSAFNLASLQLGPDGKIYVAQLLSNHVGVISKPNTLGPACNYIDKGIFLGEGKSFAGLPNHVASLFYKHPIATFDFTNSCLGSETHFTIPVRPAGFSFLWDFGDPASGTANAAAGNSPTHIFSAPGTYLVKLIIDDDGGKKIIERKVEVKALPIVYLGEDTAICPGSTLTLNAGHDGSSYQWQDGSTAQTFVVKKPGTYFAAVKDAGGCVNTGSINISFVKTLEVYLGQDTTLCEGNRITLDAGNPGQSYEWQDGALGQTYAVSKAGTYWVDVKHNTGCITRDSITIVYLTPPVINLGQDTTLCAGQSLTLTKNLPGVKFLWQDGSTTNSFKVTKPGKYWVRGALDVCSETDTILVSYFPALPVAIEGDTVLCRGSSLLLSVNVPGSTYRWQDNSTSSSFLVQEEGSYSVTTTQGYCAMTSTIRVYYQDCEPFIPNVLTPNGDGLNEAFTIKQVEVGQWQLQVYNRYGILVYQSNSYHNDWAGKDDSAGIYYYKLSNARLNKNYKGFVEIIR
jgi:gliding motility-associated-like protein